LTVTVRGAHGGVIAEQTVTHFVHRRRSRRFVFHSRGPGIRVVVVKPMADGRQRVNIKARRFINSGAAESPEQSVLELRLGQTGCFRQAATSVVGEHGAKRRRR